MPSQCIYRVIQYFLSHGNDPWFFIVHGILLCMVFVHGFLPFLILRFFCPFYREWGYVAINSQLPCIYGGRNNNVLDQFEWNLIVKVKTEGLMVGL